MVRFSIDGVTQVEREEIVHTVFSCINTTADDDQQLRLPTVNTRQQL